MASSNPGGCCIYTSSAKNPCKKGIAHINLSKAPTTRHSKRQNQANCGRLHHGAKSISVVNPMLLSETASNKTSFVLINRPIRTMLGFENPLAAHNINTRWPRHQHPGVSVTESSKLLGHGGTPGRFTQSITMGNRRGEEGTKARVVPNRAISVRLLLARMITMACNHSMRQSCIASKRRRRRRGLGRGCRG